MIVVKVNLARDSVKGPKYRLCCVHEAYNEWIELEKKNKRVQKYLCTVTYEFRPTKSNLKYLAWRFPQLLPRDS